MNIFAKVPIQQLVDAVANWNPLKAEADEVFTYIDLSAVDQDTKSIVAANEVACAEAPSRARQLVTSGDVLVSTVRPNLNGVAVVPDELDGATASTGFCIIRPKPSQLDSRYTYHWVRSPAFVSEMVSLATGASYPAVSDKIVLGSRIPLPPRPEQRRIAAILDQADALRAKRREALAQLDRLTQAIFVDMFGDPATNPLGWSRVSLGELIEEGPQNGLYKPSTDYGSGTPILRIDAFYDGVVTNLNALRRVRLSPEEVQLFGLRANDIVINRVNSLEYLGKSALIPALSEPTVFESNMMRLRTRRSVVNPVYMVEFMQSGYVKSQILTCAKNAVNQSSINQQDVKGFSVNVPPLSLQDAFAGRVQAIESIRSIQRTGLHELDALFTSLQHRAFLGEL